MKEYEFLAKVRERGNYGDQAEAEAVTRAVLAVLGGRLAGGEAGHLAAQLPEPLRDAVSGVDQGGEGYGVEEFLSRVASSLGTSAEVATWDASAVLTTVGEAVSGGQLNQVLSQLPSSYATLFGKPELA